MPFSKNKNRENVLPTKGQCRNDKLQGSISNEYRAAYNAKAENSVEFSAI